jgi:predicted permease
VGNVPLDYRIGVDARAIVFAMGLALITALMCGLIPAFRSTRVGLMDAMKAGGAVIPAGGRMRKLLLVVQVALSTVLVTSSMLFLGTLAGVTSVPVGFRADGILALLVQGRPSGLGAGREYFDELLSLLRALPGVERVSIANQLPMQFAVYFGSGEVSLPGEAPVAAEAHCAFPEYFATLRAPMLAGREFQAQDRRAAVIGRQLSRRLFGAESAVGQTLRVTKDRKTGDWEIVGVAADMKYGSPREPVVPVFYLPCLEEWTPRQAGAYAMGIAVRGAGSGLDRAARRELEAMGRQYVVKSAPLRDLVRQRVLRERMLATVSSVFGAVTLAVVAFGLFGLMAFVVATRTREIAIRMALGAQRSSVRWLMAREMLVVVALGLAIGLGGAAAGWKLIASYLFGVRAFDPLAPALTALVLAVTGAMAALIPVRRAIALEPMEALRHE